MYIRRKVYSVLTDDYGQERLFSTNEVCLEDYEDYYVDDRLFADIPLVSGNKMERARAALEAGAKKTKAAAAAVTKLNKNGVNGVPLSRFAKLKGKLLKNKNAAALGAGIGLATAAGTIASAASNGV